MRFSTTILPIAALLTSTFFLMAGAGLMGILLPVRGSIEGWSSYEIGLFGTSYAIAFMAGDKVRQDEIKSDPSFDYGAYNAKAGANLMKSLECVMRRRG